MATVSSMVVADDRARRQSQGLQQKVLGCSGKLLNVEKDKRGYVVRERTLVDQTRGNRWAVRSTAPT